MLTYDLVTTQRDVEGSFSDVQDDILAVSALEVHNQDDIDFATDVIRQLRTRRKELEDQRTSVTAPLTQVLETVRSWFRPSVQALEKCEKLLRERILQAHEESAKQRQAALVEAQTQEQICAIVDSSIAPADSSFIRYTWDFEVCDVTKIPRAFLCVDADKVHAHIKATDGKVEISGIKFVRRGSLTVRK